MSVPNGCRLIGRWRITGADVWDVDPSTPASLTIEEKGFGELRLSTLTAGLSLEYARRALFFDWEGDDDGNDVRGTGDAQLQDDGSLEINWNYSTGDAIVLVAERATSSAAC